MKLKPVNISFYSTALLNAVGADSRIVQFEAFDAVLAVSAADGKARARKEKEKASFADPFDRFIAHRARRPLDHITLKKFNPISKEKVKAIVATLQAKDMDAVQIPAGRMELL